MPPPAIPPTALAPCTNAPATRKPTGEAAVRNILFLITEDQGLQIGALGTPGLRTPTMDGLAAEGALLTNAHVTLPTCTGSKSSLFTGYTNHNTGSNRNVNEFVGSQADLEACAARGEARCAFYNDRNSPYYVHRIREELPTLIEILHSAGWFTGLHNKFHLSPHTKFPYDVWDARNSHFAQVRDFIAAAAGRPWFLTHVIQDPHRPYLNSELVAISVDPDAVEVPAHLPDTDVARRDWAEYLDGVQRADANTAQVLRALDESGASDQTLVVFMGDHGPSYHRAKLTTYGFGLRAPVVFRGPGVAAGSVRSELFGNVDMMVTMLDFLGLDMPQTQGVSFRPLLTGASTVSARECVVGETRSDRSIFDGRYRLIETPIASDTDMPADNRDFNPWGNRVYAHIRDNADTPGFEPFYRLLDLADHALPRHERPALEFYDNQGDPWEVDDLGTAPALTAERERLAALLDRWRADTADALR